MFKILSKETIAVFLILFTLLAIAFYDVFFLNKTFKATTTNSQALPEGAYGYTGKKLTFIPVNGTDSPVMEEPLYQFIKNNLKKGILPLWNPHQACGYPLISMIEVGMFFPLSFIMYLLPEYFAWDILILTRFLLAGIFTYCLMRVLGFKKIPSLASGITFMLSGPMVLLQYWTVNVDILAPLVLIALEKLIQKPNKRHIAYGALITGLTFFAGHPEHIFLVQAYGFVYFCFRFFSLKKFLNWKKTFSSLALAYILGISLSSVILFPFLWDLIFEFWHAHPPLVGLKMEEQLGRILSLAVPYFFQKESLTYDFTFAGWWGGYLGTIPLALCFLSLFSKHKKGLNYLFFGVGFVLLAKAYCFPLVNWIGYLPFFNLIRYAIHTPHLVALTVAILAGMGMREILTGKNLTKKALFYTVTLIIITIVHLIYYQSSSHFEISLQASLYALGILSIFHLILFLKDKKILKRQLLSLILIVFLFGELFSYILREKATRFNSFGHVPYIEFLKQSNERVRSYGIFWAFYPNTATGFEVDDLGIFMSLLPKRFVEFINTTILEIFKADLRSPALRAVPIHSKQHILNMLNIKYLITPKAEHFDRLVKNVDVAQNTNLIDLEKVNVFERKDYFPRAFIVHRAIFQNDTKISFEILKKIEASLRGVALINGPPDLSILYKLQNIPLTDKSQANIIKYTPNEVVIEALMENPGFLVLADAYHPDWRVYINGKKGKLYLTNNLIRSVFLPAGNHNIRFIFYPLSFYGGLIVSAASLSLILFLLFIKTKK